MTGDRKAVAVYNDVTLHAGGEFERRDQRHDYELSGLRGEDELYEDGHREGDDDRPDRTPEPAGYVFSNWTLDGVIRRRARMR